MKAVILAAGFGKRLKPLTDYLPKVLVPILDKPAIDHVLERLISYGLREVGVNLHYQADQLIAYLRSKPRSDLQLNMAREEQILGTGGALYNLRDFLSGQEPFWVYNGDIICDLDLNLALKFHCQRRPLATLLLWDYPPINTVWCDQEGNIIDVSANQGNRSKSNQKDKCLTFTGISILDPKILDYLPPGYSEMPEIYRSIIKTEGIGRICGVRARGKLWADFGTISRYLDLHRELLLLGQSGIKPPKPPSLQPSPQRGDGFEMASPTAAGEAGGTAAVPDRTADEVNFQSTAGTVCDPFRQMIRTFMDNYIFRGGKNITVSPGTTLEGFLVIGDQCLIEEGVYLKDCVLWPGTRVVAGTRACRAILTRDFIYREKKSE